MDKQGGSAKKRKVAEKAPQKPEALVIAKPLAAKCAVKQRKPVNGSRSLAARSKKRRKGVNKGLAQSGEGGVSEVVSADIDVTSSSAKTFTDLDLAPEIQKAIASIGYSELKEIQRNSIPSLLTSKDAIVTSTTGSGKSLSALISSISLLQSKHFKPRNGTGVIILTPTRELAHQLLGVAVELLEGAPQTAGIITDRSNFRSEGEKLEKGVNVLIATPRQLLEHLKKTTFVIKGMKTLVIDDGEQLLGAGIKETVQQIIELLPKKKQIVLLTNTDISTTSIIETLHLKKPIVMQAEGSTSPELVVPAGSRVQGYVMVEPEKRFLLLFSFVKKFQKKKVVVVMSSTAAAKGYADILNAMGLPAFEIHGKQTTQKRAMNLSDFKEAGQGTLVCTDVVARNLEIPTVDWNIQYDPPENPTRYISHLGRTAAKSVIFLQPSEAGFTDYLKEAGVTTEEFEFSDKQLVAVQGNLEKLINKNYVLNCEAKGAFRSYIKNYTAHILPSVFPVAALDLVKVAKSFGFNIPPRVEVEEPEVKEEKWQMTYGPELPGLKGVKRKRRHTG